MSALAAGSTVCDARYRLDAVVGRGGMAVVWRATDLQLERDVAIKIISDVLASDPRFVARFEREARLAAGLNHPNLVKVFDFSVEGERPCLIMEYVPGGTLAEARGQGGLDVDALARDLLDAVAHIHAAGILHRDIKPANVLLDGVGAPRLTDFGIARGDETSGLTQTGQILGTLRYIAPEVAAGEPAAVRSDLYSLGVLLSEVDGTRSEALDRLLPRMSDRDPANRPASATEALAELDPTRMLAKDPDTEPTAPLEGDPHEGPPRPGGLPPQPPDAASHQGGLTPYAAETFTPVRGQAPSMGSGVLGRRGLAPRSSLRRSHAVAGALVLVAVFVIVVVAASGGGGGAKRLGIPDTTQVQPAPAGAPADQQIDRLERIVRAAPAKR